MSDHQPEDIAAYSMGCVVVVEDGCQIGLHS
jgi:hypothetical protein